MAIPVDRYRVEERPSFDRPPCPYFVVVEKVGFHKGEWLTMTWDAIYTTREDAERAARLVFDSPEGRDPDPNGDRYVGGR